MKAELFSSDFVMGLSLFLTAIVIFELFYSNLHAEINDYKDYTEIVFEIPGMSEEDVIIEFNNGGNQLFFKAENTNRKFMKTVQLPFISSQRDYEIDVKNGLAIILAKKSEK